MLAAVDDVAEGNAPAAIADDDDAKKNVGESTLGDGWLEYLRKRDGNLLPIMERANCCGIVVVIRILVGSSSSSSWVGSRS